jgi:DNA-binding FrmR family transcriptional regulator
VELHHHVMNRVRQELEAFAERVAERLNLDEKSIRTLVRAVVSQEIARIDSTIMENISTLKAEVEELSKQGVDAETIRRMIEERFGRLLGEIKQLLDQRTMHLIDVINEISAVNKDVLDLVSEILRHELTFEEELGKLRSALDEERLEEIFYRMLVRKGVLKRRRRKWVPLVVGLGILAAIVTGLLLSPIVTLVILFIVFVVLMRW